MTATALGAPCSRAAVRVVIALPSVRGSSQRTAAPASVQGGQEDALLSDAAALHSCGVVTLNRLPLAHQAHQSMPAVATYLTVAGISCNSRQVRVLAVAHFEHCGVLDRRLQQRTAQRGQALQLKRQHRRGNCNQRRSLVQPGQAAFLLAVRKRMMAHPMGCT